MDALSISTDLQMALIKDLHSKHGKSEVLTKITAKTHEVLEASACTIFLINPRQGTATQYAGTGYQEQFIGKKDINVIPANQVPSAPKPEEEIGITGWIMSTGKSFLAGTPEELRAHSHHSGKRDSIQLPNETLAIQTFLGVPIRNQLGEVIGLLKAERRILPEKKVNAFSIGDQIVLESIARVASMGLLYQDMAKKGKKNEAITAWVKNLIIEAASTKGELDSFLVIIASVIASAIPSDSCGIYLIDESKKTLTQRAGNGSQAPRYNIRSYRLLTPEQISSKNKLGLTAWIAATGQTVYAKNREELSAHPHHKGEFDPLNFPDEDATFCGAFIGTPLKIGGTITGVLKVENISKKGQPDERVFSEETQRRFSLLAQDVALAIERFQDQSHTRYQVIHAAQPTLSEIFGGALGIRELVNKVVVKTAELLKARACALFLKDGDKLVQPSYAAYGWSTQGPQQREYSLVDPDKIMENPSPEEKVGLTVWIAAKRESFTARSNLELRMHPHHKGTFDKYNFNKGQQCEAFMSVPLIAMGELIGVLKVETKIIQIEPDKDEFTYFTEQDELVFKLIANSTANTIQFIRTEREKERLAELKEISAKAAHRINNQVTNYDGIEMDIKHELLLNPQLKGNFQPIVSRLRKTTIDLKRMVNEFKNFGMPLKLNRELTNINDVLSEETRIFKQQTARLEENIQVIFNQDSGIHLIPLDKARFSESVKELLNNSKKALMKDPVKPKKITISTSLALEKNANQNRKFMIIKIEDNGPGIPEDLEVFSPFISTYTDGTGLGLATVKELIEAHGGRIKFIPVKKGACVEIYLPSTQGE